MELPVLKEGFDVKLAAIVRLLDQSRALSREYHATMSTLIEAKIRLAEKRRRQPKSPTYTGKDDSIEVLRQLAAVLESLHD